MSRKPTWLYTVRTDVPELEWRKGEQRLHPVALARHGYAKARRIGTTSPATSVFKSALVSAL